MNEIYKKITVLSEAASKITTEIMFEVASARADGIGLLRFEIKPREDVRIVPRVVRAARKVLRDMKGRGAIQFFAFPESIEEKSTEYEFIMNKYSSLVGAISDCEEGGSYVYVKL